jgi:glutaredoxin 3
MHFSRQVVDSYTYTSVKRETPLARHLISPKILLYMNGHFAHAIRHVLSFGEYRMPKVVMYSTGYCPYCDRAERLLKHKGVTDLEKIRVDLDPAQRELMMERTQRRTVPQIYIDDYHVGGFDDLAALEHAGKLEPLLKGAGE